MSNNNDNLNEAIAILQTMNMEDCAMAIQDLRNELDRVKGIAYRRLDRIAQLQHEVAVLEDKLEDTRSDLKYAQGVERAQQSAAGCYAQDLADARKRIVELEREAEIANKLAENRLERIFNLFSAIDSPNPVLARDNELAAAADELMGLVQDEDRFDPESPNFNGGYPPSVFDEASPSADDEAWMSRCIARSPIMDGERVD